MKNIGGIVDQSHNPFTRQQWIEDGTKSTPGRQEDLEKLFGKTKEHIEQIGDNKGRYPAFNGIRWGFAEIKDNALIPTAKWDNRRLYDGYGNLISRESLSIKKQQAEVINMNATQHQNVYEEFGEACNAINLYFSENITRRFVAGLHAKKFILLTGLSGSGKTKLAQAFARWLTPISTFEDVFAQGRKIPSSNKTYIVNRSDAYSVEFRNSEDESDATIVTLPREMIKQWADHITSNSLDSKVKARAIREGVVEHSKYSSQLHSFETHLKASALALLEAQKIKRLEKCYEIVPVGADWTSNENIVGYPNGLDSKAYVATPALMLILRSLDPANKDIPHFLILDEMNLSHVERYFADILSAIESGEEIPLYEGEERSANGIVIPQKLRLPNNLFIIGTVNVDETTYMFSPKVLDRANVIEFRMNAVDLSAFLEKPEAPDLGQIAGKGAQYGASFVASTSQKDIEVPEIVQERFKDEMLLLFSLLREHNAEFGYRVAHESARFIHFYHSLGAERNWFEEAMDAIIVQKILPKIHGSRSQLEGLLWALAWVCGAEREAPNGLDFITQVIEAGRAQDESIYGPETLWSELKKINSDAPYLAARYPLSYEKVMRMWRKLVRDQFVSFAEA